MSYEGDNAIVTRSRGRWKHPFLFVGLVTLTACVSVPESRYYTLDMRDSEGAPESVNVEVGRFHSSDALARREILIQAAPTRVEYYAVDQWASDLSEMIQEKLQIELGSVGIPGYRIEGDIVGFEQVDGEVGADAHVKLRVRAYDTSNGRSSDPVLRKTYEESTPAAEGTPDAVVSALSHTLEVIAVQIAHDLSTL